MKGRAAGLLTENIELTLSLNSFIKLLLTVDASTSDAVLSFRREPSQNCRNIQHRNKTQKSKYSCFFSWNFLNKKILAYSWQKKKHNNKDVFSRLLLGNKPKKTLISYARSPFYFLNEGQQHKEQDVQKTQVKGWSLLSVLCFCNVGLFSIKIQSSDIMWTLTLAWTH